MLQIPADPLRTAVPVSAWDRLSPFPRGVMENRRDLHRLQRLRRRRAARVGVRSGPEIRQRAFEIQRSAG